MRLPAIENPWHGGPPNIKSTDFPIVENASSIVAFSEYSLVEASCAFAAI